VQARYERSLFVLEYLKIKGMKTKSGIMCGMGETEDEVIETLQDLRNVGVEIITLGQYMQPTPRHLAVAEYIHPDQFAKYKEIGLEMGFEYIESGPLVRSSYHAEQHLKK
jgi:lipoic acid synthetase